MLPGDCCGLGYKHASPEDGYKILRFHTGNGGMYKPRAEIYDLKYKTWTRLDFSWDWYVFKPYRGVSLNGNVYWIAAWNHVSKVFIQSFDFSVEKFEPLCSLPSTCVGSTFMALSDFRRDKPSLLQEREETFDIWVTSKIKKGVVISWTKLFSVPRPNLPVLHASSRHHVIISPPVYFVDKNNRIVVCSEEQDMNYVCAKVYVIGFEKSIGLKNYRNGGIRWPSISGYAHLPSLVPVS
ncbi:unnamed protein product [Thlaspi arvense]|uniref:F-box associated beta-propeller type 1 domain-containing protein n=1 Tax=Thlaspi arvense TaxID=13288 RepID=A0AAU9SZY7_THLAR|nr:unnamed protein product [Thlaspi arvense]